MPRPGGVVFAGIVFTLWFEVKRLRRAGDRTSTRRDGSAAEVPAG